MSARKFFLDHDNLGRVLITVDKRAKNYNARWKADGLHLTVPVSTTYGRVLEVLGEMTPRLLARRPSAVYTDGMTIEVPGLTVRFSRQSMFPDKVNISSCDVNNAVLYVGSGMDFNSPSTVANITKALKVIARHAAPHILLPQAREISASLGVAPLRWEIGRGDRRLGCCNSSGVISLSAICVFLNEELRRYIVCHELAHLTEMNHSARFHALCNRYLNGRERELIGALRAYRWPIAR